LSAAPPRRYHFPSKGIEALKRGCEICPDSRQILFICGENSPQMGIPGLLSLLSNDLVDIDMRVLKGKTVGVDGYSWLYKSASTCAVGLYQDPRREDVIRAYISYCTKKCQMLLKWGVRLYFVFDGEEHPMKAETTRKRKEMKERIRKEIERHIRHGRKKEALGMMRRCVKVDKEMVRNLISELEAMGIPHIVAPYEADSQLAYLEKSGIIEYILTEDSDLVVYGGRRIIFKMDECGVGRLFDRESVSRSPSSKGVGVLVSKIQEIVSLSGCDYTDGIRGVGINTALKLMMAQESIENCILYFSRKKRVPLSYLDECVRVIYTFNFQVVYDPVLGRRTYLSDINEEYQGVLGEFHVEKRDFLGRLEESLETRQSEEALAQGDRANGLFVGIK
jgi:exonuclease 1